ncbi:MAG: DUF952 domain-containing protein [Rubripirellula sp.]
MTKDSMPNPLPSVLYKVVSSEVWEAAQREGRFLGAGIDAQDGFIHLSAPDQVVETVEKHFAGQSNLVLIGVEAEKLGESLKWEPSRGGALFPHVYGPIELNAVTNVQPLPLGADGKHQFPTN